MFSILILVLDNFILSLGFRSQDNYLPWVRKGYNLSTAWLTQQPSSSFGFWHKSKRGLTWPADWLNWASLATHLAQQGSKWSVVSHMTFLVATSQTVQPLGSHPQALWVTTQGEQVASWGGGYPLCRGAVGKFYRCSQLGGVWSEVKARFPCIIFEG